MKNFTIILLSLIAISHLVSEESDWYEKWQIEREKWEIEREKWEKVLLDLDRDLASAEKSQKILLIESLGEHFFKLQDSAQCEKAVSILIKTLRDPEEAVRSQASKICLKIADSSAFNLVKIHITPLQNDQNKHVCKIAKKILEEIESNRIYFKKPFSKNVRIDIKRNRYFASFAGGTINLNIENLEDRKLNDVLVKLYVPFPVKYKSSSSQPQWKENDRTVEWTLSELKPKEKVTLSVVLKNGSPIISLYVNLKAEAIIDGIVDSFDYERILGRCTHCSCVGWLSSHDSLGQFKVGEPFSYMVTYQNSRLDVKNTRLVYTLSDNLIFLKATPKNYTVKGNKIFFSPIPFTKQSQKIHYEIQCKAKSPGFAKGIAEIENNKLKESYFSLIEEEETRIYKEDVFSRLLANLEKTTKIDIEEVTELTRGGADVPGLLSALLHLLNFEQEKPLKIKIIRAIAKIQSSFYQDITILLSNFTNNDKDIREELIRCAITMTEQQKLKHKDVLSLLLPLLVLENEKENKIILIRKIRSLKDPNSITSLISCFDHENPDVKSEVVDALSYLKVENDQVLFLIKTAFVDSHGSVRKSAAAYVAEMQKKDPSYIPFLVKGLEDVEIYVQKYSIQALTNIGYFDDKVILSIADKLNNKNLFWSAIDYLEKAEKKAEIAVSNMLLVRLKNRFKRQRLANTLKGITGKHYTQETFRSEETIEEDSWESEILEDSWGWGSEVDDSWDDK